MGIGFSFFFCHKSWVNSWRKKNVAAKKYHSKVYRFFSWSFQLTQIHLKPQAWSTAFLFSEPNVFGSTPKEKNWEEKKEQNCICRTIPHADFFPINFLFFICSLRSFHCSQWASHAFHHSKDPEKLSPSTNDDSPGVTPSKRKHGCLATKFVFVHRLGPGTLGIFLSLMIAALSWQTSSPSKLQIFHQNSTN